MHHCPKGLLRSIGTNYLLCVSSIPQLQIHLEPSVFVTAASFFSSMSVPFHKSRQKYQMMMYHNKAGTEKKPLPRNSQITAKWISVVDEFGKMKGTFLTEDVLSDFDFDTKSLVTVVEGNLADGRPPLCKVMDRSTLRKNEFAAVKKKKKKAPPVKVIEISWSVEKHDMETKLRRIKEFLMKGYKIDVLLKMKRKGRDVTTEEGEKLINDIFDAVKEAGGKEQRPSEGDLLGTMEFWFVLDKTRRVNVDTPVINSEDDGEEI